MFSQTKNHLQRGAERWLFRLQGAEAGEVFLNQRRVFIVPSGAGLAFVAMLAVLFVGSVNYNLNLGFAFTFLIAACAVVDMHLTFRNLAYLHLAAGRTTAIFCGDVAQFELHLMNRRRYDRFAIWLDFADKQTSCIAQAADVPAAGSTSVVLSTVSTARGWLPAPRVRLLTRFPMGLLRAWSYWQPDTKVLVYPQPEPQAQVPALPLLGSALEQGNGPAGHDDFAGIRAYQPGDAMRHLAWRQIARVDLALGGTLVTKHFEGGAVQEYRIDYAALPNTLHLEHKLSRMTRWVLDAEARGAPYAFRLGDLSLPAACGPAQQKRCLQALAEFQLT